MADFLDTMTHVINSPPGVLLAGGVLATGIWKFFDRIEGVVTDQTKADVAMWLRGIKTEHTVAKWPLAISGALDHLLGDKLSSWKCFRRSCVVFCLISAVSLFIAVSLRSASDTHHIVDMVMSHSAHQWLVVVGFAWIVIIPAHLNLLLTRGTLRSLQSLPSTGFEWFVALTVATGWTIGVFMFLPVKLMELGNMLFHSPAVANSLTAMVMYLVLYLHNIHSKGPDPLSVLWATPILLITTVLWVYVVSCALLKMARRLDIGFGLFNGRIDIDKHPVQAIGLVAGAIVASLYWATALLVRL